MSGEAAPDWRGAGSLAWFGLLRLKRDRLLFGREGADFDSEVGFAANGQSAGQAAAREMMHVNVIAPEDHLCAGIADNATRCRITFGNEGRGIGLVFNLHVQPFAANPERRPTSWYTALLEIPGSVRLSGVAMVRMQITRSLGSAPSRRRLNTVGRRAAWGWHLGG